jgi:AcrR family transcriptional regulator
MRRVTQLGSAAKDSPKPTGRRAENSIRNRRALLQAAAEVVAEFGYADASIARITQRAGLAQGTFYLYFASRQELFDQLLPEVGRALLDFLGSRVKGARDVFDIEERAFRASFEYLAANPGFYRILNEAEVAAPKAFEEHFRNVARRYLTVLKRARADGALRGYEDRQVEVIVYMLMGARSYINLRFAKNAKGRRLPEWITDAYIKFVRAGFAAIDDRGEAALDGAGRKPPRRATAARDEQ